MTEPSEMPSPPSAVRTIVSAIMVLGSALVLGFLKLGTDKLLTLSASAEERDLYFFCFQFGLSLDKFLFVGAMASVFMPLFHREKLNNPDTLAKSVANIFNCLLIYCLAVVGVVWCFAPQIVALYASDFSPEKQERAADLLRIFMPYSVLFSLWIFGSILLQSVRKFRTFSLVKLIAPATLFIFMGLLWQQKLSLEWVIGSVSIGMALQVFFLTLIFYKNGYPPKTVLNPFAPLIREIMRLSAFLLIGTVITLAVLWLKMHLITRGGDDGQLANFSLMERFKDFYSMNFVGLLPLILLPGISESITAKKNDKALDQTAKGLKLMLFVTAPVTLFLLYFSAPIIRLIYESENFTASNIDAASILMMIFMAGMITQCGLLMFGRMPQLFKDTKTVAIVTVTTQLLMIPLHLIFFYYFGYFGPAITDAVVPIATTCMYLYFLRKHLPNILGIFKDIFYVKWVISLGLTFTMGYFARLYYFPEALNKLETGATLFAHLVLWGIAYFMLSFVFMIPELKLFYATIKRK